MSRMQLRERIKKAIITFLLCGCMIVWIGACQVRQSKQSPSLDIQHLENGNVVITASDFKGVILTRATSEDESNASSDHWTPKIDDILTLEEKIEDYLSKNDFEFNSNQAPTRKALAGYYRQYDGVIKNDKRVINVFFFCDSLWEDEEWQKDYVDVSGGGDCFFYVDYDVDKGVFYNIRVNAPK